MKNFHFLICLFVLLQMGCQSPETKEVIDDDPISENPVDNLTRIWQLKEYKLIDSDGQLDETKKENMERRAKRDGYQLCFLPHKKGNSIIGEIYEPFEWSLNNNTLTLTRPTGETILRNVQIEKGEKGWTLTAEENGTSNISMYASSKLASTLEEEPFHPMHNQWRIKATKHESEKELKNRLLNYVTHIKLLFKASIDDPKRTFTNSKSDGIIQIYAGGIGFLKESAIPTEWVYTFYDEYQAKEAYDFFKKYLNNKVLKKTAPKDFKPVNYQLLQELETKIKADIDTL